MTRQEIQLKVIEAAAEQAGVSAAEVTPATHFVNDLNFDSLDRVEFAMEMEDEFSLSIKDEDVERLTTVGEVVDYIADPADDDAAAAPASSA